MNLENAQKKFEKFRRKCWRPEVYLCYSGGVLVTYEGRPAFIGKASFGNDWEEYREETTVRDIRNALLPFDDDEVIFFEDMDGNRVKGFLKLKPKEEIHLPKSLGALFG